MTDRSIAHGTFVLERKYPASPARVFRAWADPAIKQRWFGDGNTPAKIFDFREGGRELMESGEGEFQFGFDVRYEDIVENNRIIYTYYMTMGGKRISVSVAAMELFADGDGTRMTVTEHGCFLDGLDNMQQRRRGTDMLLDALGAELAREAAN
ncbi:SRPBCC family protein [Devosia sp. SL43]|uniref:SRPBCC family protein n=1 Tax=Devosia sp. SL43 TaxID=2806348 RepID=UPI001F17E9CB|nr:SRPBCC family protein [Devosia sp. SL43]UJW86707.1 SRPBCC family protein [Devosia sp. SL43]